MGIRSLLIGTVVLAAAAGAGAQDVKGARTTR